MEKRGAERVGKLEQRSGTFQHRQVLFLDLVS